ncbi:MAG: hypothetical protein Q7R87_02990 [Nanoarchaeota archaeon]|nr:hypothetical protein [Nanoarchaeota archaeon]
MVNKWVIAVVLIMIFVVIGFSLKQYIFVNKYIGEEDVLKENAKEVLCQSDSDCVPKEACHPKTCINKEFAQDSSGSICTAVCEPGTLDCGQGSCSCLNNKCNAVFK